MTKKLLFILIMLLCNSISAMANERLKSLTVILDWFVNPQHAPLIIAQEQGFFKQHGLKVNIIAPADSNDGPKLVAVGKADIAISYQPELYLQVDNGLPLVRIGTLVSVPLGVIAVLQDSKIHSLADLKGKTIGYSMSGVNIAILATMLQYHGVQLKDVKLINVHYNLVQALLSHHVDAISDAQYNFEIPELALAKHPARVFYPEKNGVPPYDELIFLANRHCINDPRLLAFMQAVQQGAEFIHQHPLASWRLLIKHHPELNNQLNKEAWKITQPLFAVTPLQLNTQSYRDFAQWMLQHKLIHKVLPLRYYGVDLRLLQNKNAVCQQAI